MSTPSGSPDLPNSNLKRSESLLALIGNTPLVRLNSVTANLPDSVEVWVKLEFMNPGGSIKDRTARQIVTDAIEEGLLGQGQTLIDVAHGNMAVAYAMVGASLGVPVELVMPDTSDPRRKMAELFGARVIATDASAGLEGARAALDAILKAADKAYFFADQASNPSNPRAHELTTAKEIWDQTEGRITHFVACMQTAGSVVGTARGLKGLNAQVNVVGCGTPAHPVRDFPEVDQVLTLDPVEGASIAARLALEEGIASGDQASLNVAAALKVASGLSQGVVVTFLCDHVDRLLSR